MYCSGTFIAPSSDLDPFLVGGRRADNPGIASYIREKTADFDVLNEDRFVRQDITDRVRGMWALGHGERPCVVGEGALARGYGSIAEFAQDVWGALEEEVEDEDGTRRVFCRHTVPYPTYDELDVGCKDGFTFRGGFQVMPLWDYLKEFDAEVAAGSSGGAVSGDGAKGRIQPTFDTGAIADAEHGIICFIDFRHYAHIERVLAKQVLPSLQESLWKRLSKMENARGNAEYRLRRELMLAPYRAYPEGYSAIAFRFNSVRVETRSGKRIV